MTNSIKLWITSFEHKIKLNHIQYIDAHSKDRAYVLCITLENALKKMNCILNII